MLPEEISEDISEDIVNDNHHRRQHKVDESLIGVAAHRPGRSRDQQSGNDDPPEQSELILQEPLLQTQHKAEEPDNEEREPYEVVVDEQPADQRILNAQIGQLRRDEPAQTEIVIRKVDVPIDVLGHRDLDLFLLMPLYLVDLREDEETEEENAETGVQLAC